MKVLFIVANNNGIYSQLASAPQDARYIMVYDIDTLNSFNTVRDIFSLHGQDLYETVVDIVSRYNIPMIVLGFYDAAFLRELMGRKVDVFITMNSKRISDVIYRVGGA